jgi:hypothetical protein
MKTWQYLSIGLLAISPVFSMHLAPNTYEGGRTKDEVDREIRNSSALATILGEIRTNMSDLMFIKTERYLHGGVAYMPHLDMDKVAASGEIDHKDDPGGKFANTLIPPPEQDFRGLIGDLHRKVKPWQDPSMPHSHTTGEELLPWYRLMTMTDPHNIRGYLIGAWWLKGRRTPTHDAEALRFIEEGIRNNPRSFSLHLMHGNILRGQGRIEEAVAAFHRAAGFAVEQRPHERVQPFIAEGLVITLPGWGDYQEEDARASVRMSVLAERQYGDPAKALELAERYDQAFLGDARLRKIISELRSELN